MNILYHIGFVACLLLLIVRGNGGVGGMRGKVGNVGPLGPMGSGDLPQGTRGGVWGRIWALRFRPGSRDPGLSAQHNIGLLILGQK